MIVENPSKPKAKAPSSANTPGPDSKSRMLTSISLQEGSLLVSGRAELGGAQFSKQPTVHLKLAYFGRVIKLTNLTSRRPYAPNLRSEPQNLF